MPSKQVEIHRHYGFVQASNQDPEVREYFGMAYKAIGSFYKVFGKVYESGLTREEENLLVPEMVGFYPEDRKEFREAVNKFYKNINTKVPSEGLKLEIGLEHDGPVSKDNFPINIDHYIRYRHAIKHPQVSMSLEEAERMGNLSHYYILDKAEETKSRSKINKLEDEASMYYFKYRDDAFKVDQMLTLLAIDIRTLDAEEKTLKLKELSTVDNNLGDKVNEARLQKFINIATDRDLAIKYDITEMIRFNILEKVKFKVLDKDSGEVIGDNVQESVLWFKDKRNSRAVNVYYAKLNELGNSSKKYEQQKQEEPKKEIVAETITMSGKSELDEFNASTEDDNLDIPLDNQDDDIPTEDFNDTSDEDNTTNNPNI